MDPISPPRRSRFNWISAIVCLVVSCTIALVYLTIVIVVVHFIRKYW